MQYVWKTALAALVAGAIGGAAQAQIRVTKARIGCLDQRDEPARLDHPERFADIQLGRFGLDDIVLRHIRIGHRFYTNRFFSTLPIAFRGNASRNRTSRGTLNDASRAAQ